LISLDAAPAAYTHEHTAIFRAMNALSAEPSASAAPVADEYDAAPPQAQSGSLLSQLRTRREADLALASLLPSPADRAFVLSNLVETPVLKAMHAWHPAQEQHPQQRSRSTATSGPTGSSEPASDPTFAWRVNLPTLSRCERVVHGWSVPPPASLALWGTGPSCPALPTLFIGGANSSRLTTPAYTQALPGYFPNAQTIMVPAAAHFVHHSHAKECAKHILSFVDAMKEQ